MHLEIVSNRSLYALLDHYNSTKGLYGKTCGENNTFSYWQLGDKFLKLNNGCFTTDYLTL